MRAGFKILLLCSLIFTYFNTSSAVDEAELEAKIKAIIAKTNIDRSLKCSDNLTRFYSMAYKDFVEAEAAADKKRSFKDKATWWAIGTVLDVNDRYNSFDWWTTDETTGNSSFSPNFGSYALRQNEAKYRAFQYRMQRFAESIGSTYYNGELVPGDKLKELIGCKDMMTNVYFAHTDCDVVFLDPASNELYELSQTVQGVVKFLARSKTPPAIKISLEKVEPAPGSNEFEVKVKELTVTNTKQTCTLEWSIAPKEKSLVSSSNEGIKFIIDDAQVGKPHKVTASCLGASSSVDISNKKLKLKLEILAKPDQLSFGDTEVILTAKAIDDETKKEFTGCNFEWFEGVSPNATTGTTFPLQILGSDDKTVTLKCTNHESESVTRVFKPGDYYQLTLAREDVVEAGGNKVKVIATVKRSPNEDVDDLAEVGKIMWKIDEDGATPQPGGLVFEVPASKLASEIKVEAEFIPNSGSSLKKHINLSAQEFLTAKEDRKEGKKVFFSGQVKRFVDGAETPSSKTSQIKWYLKTGSDAYVFQSSGASWNFEMEKGKTYTVQAKLLSADESKAVLKSEEMSVSIPQEVTIATINPTRDGDKYKIDPKLKDVFGADIDPKKLPEGTELVLSVSGKDEKVDPENIPVPPKGQSVTYTLKYKKGTEVLGEQTFTVSNNIVFTVDNEEVAETEIKIKGKAIELKGEDENNNSADIEWKFAEQTEAEGNKTWSGFKGKGKGATVGAVPDQKSEYTVAIKEGVLAYKIKASYGGLEQEKEINLASKSKLTIAADGAKEENPSIFKFKATLVNFANKPLSADEMKKIVWKVDPAGGVKLDPASGAETTLDLSSDLDGEQKYKLTAEYGDVKSEPLEVTNNSEWAIELTQVSKDVKNGKVILSVKVTRGGKEVKKEVLGEKLTIKCKDAEKKDKPCAHVPNDKMEFEAPIEKGKKYHIFANLALTKPKASKEYEVNDTPLYSIEVTAKSAPASSEEKDEDESEADDTHKYCAVVIKKSDGFGGSKDITGEDLPTDLAFKGWKHNKFKAESDPPYGLKVEVSKMSSKVDSEVKFEYQGTLLTPNKHCELDQTKASSDELDLIPVRTRVEADDDDDDDDEEEKKDTSIEKPDKYRCEWKVTYKGNEISFSDLSNLGGKVTVDDDGFECEQGEEIFCDGEQKEDKALAPSVTIKVGSKKVGPKECNIPAWVDPAKVAAAEAAAREAALQRARNMGFGRGVPPFRPLQVNFNTGPMLVPGSF